MFLIKFKNKKLALCYFVKLKTKNWHVIFFKECITHTYLNDPPPTPQLTNGNSLTGLQDRQRAPLNHSRRCLENYTRNDSSTSETLDEEVDHGSFGVDAIPHTDLDHAWSTLCMNDSQD